MKTKTKISTPHLTVKAAAEDLGCSVVKVYQAIKKGALKTTTNEQGTMVILKSDLETLRAPKAAVKGKGGLTKAQSEIVKTPPPRKKMAGSESAVSTAAAAKVPSPTEDENPDETPPTRSVLLKNICFEEDLQVRAGTNAETVAAYEQLMRDREQFPPVHLFEENGKFYIGDGWHRLMAAQNRHYKSFPAVVQKGGRKDALKFALSANSSHGLPRTNADKLRAIEIAMKEFSGTSNRGIGRLCAVSEAFVRTNRDRCVSNAPEKKRVGADGKVYPARIVRPPSASEQIRLRVTEMKIERICAQIRTLDAAPLQAVRKVVDECMLQHVKAPTPTKEEEPLRPDEIVPESPTEEEEPSRPDDEVPLPPLEEEMAI